MTKRLLKTLAIVFVSIGINLNSFGQTEILGSRLPSELVVDKNYGSYEDVQIILNGIFPNGCYQKGETLVEKVGNEIFIKNRVVFYKDTMCTMALVPYSDSIQIHNLEMGKHIIFVKDKYGNYQQIKSFSIN